jgi:hypothetical protein
MCARGSAGPGRWGRRLCYLWGCGLSVSCTPGAMQAQPKVGEGRLAFAVRPRIPTLHSPVPPRWQELQATCCRRRPWPRWADDGGGRLGAYATRGAPPARPGWLAGRGGAPGRPGPGHARQPCPAGTAWQWPGPPSPVQSASSNAIESVQPGF